MQWLSRFPIHVPLHIWWKELISDHTPLQFLNIYLNTYWFRARVDSPLSSPVSICINAACNFKSFSICVLGAYNMIGMQTLLNMFSKQWCCQMSVDSSICMYAQNFELSTINTILKAISCNMLYVHVCPLPYLHQWCHPASYHSIVVWFYLWIASREKQMQENLFCLGVKSPYLHGFYYNLLPITWSFPLQPIHSFGPLPVLYISTYYNQLYQWEFQDPKMEVLYHIRPYFGGIFPYIGLIYGRYLQFRFLEWPLIITCYN